MKLIFDLCVNVFKRSEIEKERKEMTFSFSFLSSFNVTFSSLSNEKKFGKFTLDRSSLIFIGIPLFQQFCREIYVSVNGTEIRRLTNNYYTRVMVNEDIFR